MLAEEARHSRGRHILQAAYPSLGIFQVDEDVDVAAAAAFPFVGKDRRFGVTPLVPGCGLQIVPTRYRSRWLYYVHWNPPLYPSPGRAL